MWSKLVLVLFASFTVREVASKTPGVVERGNTRADSILKELQAKLSTTQNNPLELPNYRIDVTKNPFLGKLDMTGCRLANLPGIKRFGNVKAEELPGVYQNTTVETIIENARVTCNFQSSILPLKPERGNLLITTQLQGELKVNYDLKLNTGEFKSFVLSNARIPAVVLPHIDDNLQDYLNYGITEKFNTKILTFAQNFLETEIKTVINGDQSIFF